MSGFRKNIFIIIISVLSSCGFYSFRGSTLPDYMKTISIGVFDNRVSKTGLSELFTQALTDKIDKENLLKIVTENGDAEINGAIVSYKNQPYSYTSTSVRNVDVNYYSVSISVNVEFYDNVKKKKIYAGTVSADGIYDPSKENEEDGIKKAVDNIVEQIINNSLQKW